MKMTIPGLKTSGANKIGHHELHLINFLVWKLLVINIFTKCLGEEL